MKKFILFFLSISFFFKLNAQDFEWVKGMGGSSYESGASILVDNAGNTYTTGRFSGTVDFDPGSGTFNLTATSTDVFVTKLDANGNFMWAKKIGGSGSQLSNSICNDLSENIYITGSFENTTDFDPGTGTYNLSSIGSSDIFIVKLNPNGDFVWAKGFGSNSNDSGLSLTSDLSGNIYCTGFFFNVVDFDPSASFYNLSSAGGGDTFVLKMDSSGNFIWAKRIGAVSNDSGQFIRFYNSSIYCAGYFSGTVDLDPGSNTYNFTSTGSSDSYILKLDLDGNFMWVTSIPPVIYSMTNDSGGNVYVMGDFIGTEDFDSGPGINNLTSSGWSHYIAKFSTAGTFLWAKANIGDNCLAKASVGVDENTSDIILTGCFSGNVDLDPGPMIYSQTTGASYNMYISRLDSTGNFMWGKSIGGASNAWSNALAIDPSGSIYLTGTFENVVDFNFGAAVNNLTSVSWSNDVFVLKLSCPPVTPSDMVVYECGSTYTVPSGNQTYSVDGVYVDTVYSETTCIEEIFTITLTFVSPTYNTVNVVSCDSYTVPSGDETYYSSGIYSDTISNSLGCDSILTINLTIIPNSANTINVSTCGLYTVPSGDESYVAAGVYYDTIPNINGCDSVLTINLNSQNSFSNLFETSCISYTVPSGDETYTSSGVYHDTIPNYLGCDSIITINLTIIGNVAGDDALAGMCGSIGTSYLDLDDYLFNESPGGTWYDLSGYEALNLTTHIVYEDSLPVGGPYSFIYVNQSLPCPNDTAFIDVSIYPFPVLTPPASDTICDGTVYTTLPYNNTLPGCNYFSYVSTLGDTYDSVVTILPNINNITNQTFQVIVVAMANYGCYDTAYYDLIILPSPKTSISSIEVIGCAPLVVDFEHDTTLFGDSCIWYFGDGSSTIDCDNISHTYMNPGTYDVSLAVFNDNGCSDSVSYSNYITVTNGAPSSSILNPAVCDSYLSPAGNTYTSSGTYTDIIPNSVGCDSVITINLSVNSSSSNTLNIDACDSYMSPAGNTYTSSGTYIETIPTVFGCDSSLTINLTVNSVDVSTTLNLFDISANSSSALSYQWLNCDNGYAEITGETNQTFTATADGNYAVIVTENGCSDTSDCVTIYGTGISPNYMDQIQVYPNPVSNELTVSFNENLSIDQVKIINAEGQIVLSQNTAGKSKINFDVSALAAGIYSVNLTSNDAVRYVKLIKL